MGIISDLLTKIVDGDNPNIKASVSQKGSKGAIAVDVVSSLVPEAYDYVNISYIDGNPTTAIYKAGGEFGPTVATLIITYSGGNPVTITRV